MTQSDKIIIYGIISVLSIAMALFIISILLEKKIKNDNVKWLIYTIIFLIGAIIYMIFPMTKTSGGNTDISLGTVIGLCISGFTVFAAAIVYYMKVEARIAKRMIEHAERFGKELNLKTIGIPQEKNIHFSKLSFYWIGRLDERWDLHHFYTSIHKNKQHRHEIEKITHYYYNYKTKLKRNLEVVLKIYNKNIDGNKKLVFQGFELLNLPYQELNENLCFYCNSGSDVLCKKLEDEGFRRLLINNLMLFNDGMSINEEIVLLTRQKSDPSYSFFKNNYEIEFKHHLHNKKMHIQFLKEFMECFDN